MPDPVLTYARDDTQTGPDLIPVAFGDLVNKAIRVNLVAGGGAGGGAAQLQVRNVADAAWVNIGVAAEGATTLHVPIRIQGTGANVIEPLNVAPVGTEYALPVRTIGGAGGGPATIADGADVAEGTTTDAESAAGNGTVIALLKRLRTLLNGGLPAALAAGGSLKVAISEAGTATPVTQSAGPWSVNPTGETAGVGVGAAADTAASNSVIGRLKALIALLPAALVGGRLDTNLGAWLGSTAPTVGQKTMANSVPVAIASDQGAVPVSGTVAVSGTVTADVSDRVNRILGQAVVYYGGGSFQVNPSPVTLPPNVTAVGASQANVTLLSPNAKRRTLVVTNDTVTGRLRLKCGAGARADSYTVLLKPGDSWSPPGVMAYQEQVDGVWDIADGLALVTEFVDV